MAETAEQKIGRLTQIWGLLAQPARAVHLVTANSIVTAAVLYSGVIVLVCAGAVATYALMAGPYWLERTEQIRMANDKFASDNATALRKFQYVDTVQGVSNIELMFLKIGSGATVLRAVWQDTSAVVTNPSGLIEKTLDQAVPEGDEVAVKLTSSDFGSAWSSGKRLHVRLIQITTTGARHTYRPMVIVRVP